jgi:hypothetical protein
MSVLVIVDGPNVYNDVARYFGKIGAGTLPKEVEALYYQEWFDMDRLISATLPEDLVRAPLHGLGTVIVHSSKGIGNKEDSASIQSDQKKVTAFWARQGSAPNTSTNLVVLPAGSNGKETGVDTSIVVYMFETQDQWETAVLFSNDTDFVPAVWSLRRRGKRVHCSSHVDERHTPLVLACQDFFPWNVDFLRADRALFNVLRQDGILDNFLRGPEVARHKFSVRHSQGYLEIRFTAKEGEEQALRPLGERLIHALNGTGLISTGTNGCITLKPRAEGESASEQRTLKGTASVLAAVLRNKPILSKAFWWSQFQR